MPEIGDNFLRYKIISLIGSGGMGDVYLARDTQLDRKVAIKVLKPKYSHLRHDGLQRFVLEARSASALNHPNIITIYDIGEAEGSNYIASEFVDGKTLHQKMGKTGLPLAEVLNIAVQIAEALTAAHSAGIIHRDIKPENVMVRGDGYVKVLDFGLAKLTEPTPQSADVEADTWELIKTNPGMVMGTVSYMSPEQARGRPVDARSDIWSLGVVIYEMVTGKRPFTGETSSDVIAAILKTEPESIPDAPPELDRIINKTLRKDREQRYQHIKDLLIDLKDLRKEIDSGMRSDPGSLISTNGDKSVRSTGEGDLLAESTSPARARTNSISETFFAQFRLHPILITAMVIAALGAAGFGVKRVFDRPNSAEAFKSMRFTKLTTSGQAIEGMVALSSDGKYAAYAARDEGRQALWVRQTTTSGKTQIVPPGSLWFSGLAFTHDGRYVYFTATDENGQSGVYRVSTLGGDSRKVTGDAYGPVSFSPDDSQFAFIRDHRELITANSDGSGAKSIAAGEPGEAWEAPSWSPNTQKVAVRSYSAADSLMRLVVVSMPDGTREPLGSFAWPMISSLSWLPGGSGLIFSGRDPETQYSQLWIAAYPSGELNRITNEPNSYVGAATASDGRTAASVQVNRASQFWTADRGDPKGLRLLSIELSKDAGLSGLTWAADGKIVYTTRATAYQDIWVADPSNGSNRQLTSNSGSNFYPNVSPDGRSIVFVSNRTGNANLWKMEIDGNNPVQLTDSPGIEGYLAISPDGKWIIYQVADDARRLSIWKIAAEGGDPVQLTRESSSRPQISPDGKRIACKYGQSSSGGNGKIAILPIDGGEPLQLLDFPDVAGSPSFKWSNDGRSLLYIDIKNRGRGLWSQALDGGPPKLIVDPGEQGIWAFDQSRNGKAFIFALGEETSDAVLVSNFR